jgi:hypothetical protein
MPISDSQLQEKGARYLVAIKRSRLFASAEAAALANELDETLGLHKGACTDARFFDRMKVATKNEIAEKLKAIMRRVIHYIEAMANVTAAWHSGLPADTKPSCGEIHIRDAEG